MIKIKKKYKKFRKKKKKLREINENTNKKPLVRFWEVGPAENISVGPQNHFIEFAIGKVF